jgi:hypothetical protein
MYEIFFLSFKLAERKTQCQHGFSEHPGTGVFVISACIGELARKQRTLGIMRNFWPIVHLYALKPLLASLLIFKQ